MADERTPLITIVRVAPARQRYPHHTVRRICTFFLATGLAIVALASVLLLVDIPLKLPHRRHHDHNDWDPNVEGILPPSSSWPDTSGLSYTDLQAFLTITPDEHHAREWSKYYTSGPHLAGKNLSQAVWTRNLWQKFGVDAELAAYDVYISYPKDHRLALLNTKKGKTKVQYEASLEEDVLPEDSTSGLPNRIPTYHGYGANGNVTGRYVFANYGSYRDFEDLENAGIELEGKIALVKYGRIFRGLKVKRAQELGMIGIVIYSDPGDDGSITVENDFEEYPDGPARQPSSVQRGSVNFLSILPGDPTTPGYPSKPGVPRKDPHYAIPSIPSLPISYVDALPLLNALNGHGPKASEFNEFWQQGGLAYRGVKYNVGPSPEGLELNLYSEQEFTITPIWNVIGIINGSVSDEVVVMGNHRDAWIAGGAADPNSGSAAFNEVIRGFGVALESGWKPLRTIVLASWDGEEQGLLGSTEWVEEFVPWLSEATVTYLNVDVGCSGPRFRAAAAPLLDDVLIKLTNQVQSPNQTVPQQSVGDLWSGVISTMGSGSDFTAFQDFVGIPSLDMGFTHVGDSAVYHYHSNYDSFDWMDQFGDPGWHYHATIARLWALVAAEFVESPVIPFNATNYGAALERYVGMVVDKAVSAKFETGIFSGLQSAAKEFHRVSKYLDAEAKEVRRDLNNLNQIGAPKRWIKKVKLYWKTQKLNEKYKHLERQFIWPEGLPGREWYKHLIFAPGLWTGYAGAVFPPLDEAIDAHDEKELERWIFNIANQITIATGFVADGYYCENNPECSRIID